MIKSYQYLDIDINKKTYRRLRAVQGDSKSRYILVSLYDNSKAYNLSNCSVKVFGCKSDKKIFFNYAIVTDVINGKFEIELTNQALAAAGELEIQILILGTNQERLTSFSFYIDVEKSIVNDEVIESTNEFKALTGALSQVEEWNGYFEETSGKIEEKYTERLNNVDSQLKQNMNKINEQFNTNENLIINNFKTVQLVGHRGAMKFAPQNTMSSFEIAQKLGFKAIEVDLQVTSDNEIVIYHDDNLNTLTNGSGTIASKTLSEIKSYVYNQGSNVTKFNNEKIPTLDEFLIFCKGHNIIPFLEIKVTINDLIAQKIVDTVDKFGFKTSAVYFGYNINNLELIRKYSTHSRVLLSLDSYDETRLGWIKTLDGKIGIVPYVKNFTVEQLKTLTNQGLDIYPYDVKSYEEYLKCCNNGCSGMLVDNIGGHNLYESTIL